MDRRIAAVLLVLVLCIALLPSFARAETVASHQELAIKYSPVWYQDVANLKEDAICKVDFDGDWVGNNNWENLDACWNQGDVKGYVYTSVIETSTHYFITYTDFHPRDWWDINSNLMSHENDMEGVQVVVRKDGSYYGEFLLMETEAHGNLYQYSSHPDVHDGHENIDGGVLLYNGSHPEVYVESKGHGVNNYDGSPFPGGDGIIYHYGVPEQPSDPYDTNVGYGLILIRDSLWPRRFDVGSGLTYGSSYEGYWNGSSHSEEYAVTFDGDTYGDDKANPPWGWDDSDDGDVLMGDWFLNPAYTMSYHLTIDGPWSNEYTYNYFTGEFTPVTLSGASPSSIDLAGNCPLLEITGSGFMQGAHAYIRKNGISYQDTGIQDCTDDSFRASFDLGEAQSGTYDLEVVNPDMRSALLPGAITLTGEGPKPPPENSDTWYLAEGSSDWGFETYITIVNPNDSEVTTAITYMTGDGPQARPDIVLPPMSQLVVNPRDDLGSADFSTMVICREGENIAVDRRMIWTGSGAASAEGHSSIGVTSPARTWYLAEGSSDWGFECWLLIQNPGDEVAHCRVTYMIEDEGPATFDKEVPAGSRSTFNMADDIGAADASIKVESDVDVIPERAMYRNNRRGGHDSIGTTTPATDYFLAEGTTDWGFTTYVLIQNPDQESADVTVTYMTPEGAVPQAPFKMPGNSRKTIRVNDALPGKDLSTLVSADKPIIAERAMYWDNGTGEACHGSIGMFSPHQAFYLPDGETQNGYETWTLVQNPNDEDVEVEIQYMTPTGEGNVGFTDTVPSNSRRTYNMAEKVISGRAAVMVRSLDAGMPIMVERAMYWNTRGAGTDTIGGYSD